MICTRCGGLAIGETFEGVGEGLSAGGFPGLRCVNCGAVEDAVIAANKSAHSRPEPGRTPRSRHWIRPDVIVTVKKRGGIASDE